MAKLDLSLFISESLKSPAVVKIILHYLIQRGNSIVVTDTGIGALKLTLISELLIRQTNPQGRAGTMRTSKQDHNFLSYPQVTISNW